MNNNINKDIEEEKEVIELSTKDRLDNIKKYIINKIGKKRTGIPIEKICEELNIEIFELIGIVELLKVDGALLEIMDGNLYKIKSNKNKDDIYRVPDINNTIKLLAIADTHLVNKADRLDILKYLYEKAAARGVKHVLHAGDLTDGKSNRAEHIYELKKHSYEEQIKYVVDKYPHQEGVQTYAIAGNHDLWWYKSTGSDIVKAISNQRDDITYLGPDVANLRIGKLGINLRHGNGGSSYSRTYKLQRYVETIPLDKDIQVVFTGHHHTSGYLHYLDKYCFQVGCLCNESPFVRSMGLSHELSCWWVDVNMDNKGNIITVIPELECFDHKRLIKRK